MHEWYKIMPATGPKATRLIENYASINLSMSIATPLTLEPTFQPQGHMDELLEQTEGAETFCAHLSQMSQLTGLDILDGAPTIWQCNWSFGNVVGKDISQTLVTSFG